MEKPCSGAPIQREYVWREVIKIETIDINLIHINLEIYPRLEVDEELVETYYLNMEAGVKFGPLTVQKDTYTLIDGFHRYHALKKLEKEKVDVEILDIPDTELRAEAIRRNTKRGKRLTKRELYHSILDLRFRDEKSLKEIAEIVDLTEGRISQICDSFEFGTRYFDEENFYNFSSKDTKIDLRQKVDTDKKEKILADIDAGLSGKEIAKKHGVSQPTVSRIKKEHEPWTSSIVYIKAEIGKAITMFRYAFMNNVLKKARLEFKENGVLIRNSESEKPPFVVAFFKDKCFIKYKVKQPTEGYVKSDILTQLKNIDIDYDPTIELALVNPRTWKIRNEKEVRTHEYSEIDWRDFPIWNVELDKDGIPKTCTVKAEVSPLAFPRNQKGKLTLVMEDKELSCSFKCHNDWPCKQKLKLLFLEKTSNARAVVNLETLDHILKTKHPFWLGMWSDRTSIAIGTGIRNRKVCFII